MRPRRAIGQRRAPPRARRRWAAPITCALVLLTAPLPAHALIRGDLNDDQAVNILDLVRLIHLLLGRASPTPTQQISADLNNDGAITAADRTLLIDTILGRQPLINRTEPQHAALGAPCILTGNRFSPSPAQNRATFPGDSDRVAAPITVASPSELTVTVPEGAQSGYLAVTVQGRTAWSGEPFEVMPAELPPPSVQIMSPTDGQIIGPEAP